MVNSNILIKNIFYMLTYAFKDLTRNNYERIAGEDFEHIHDLFAELLYMGVSCQLKQGLHKEYVLHEEVLPTLRGKLNLSGTIKERLARRVQLCCEYDEFSENNRFNQVLKTAITYLLKQTGVKQERRTKLRRVLLYFQNVDSIEPKVIRWNTFRYDQSTRTYHLLHSLCRFLFDNLLLSTEAGHTKTPQFSEERMEWLFEHFVLEYYKRHHPLCGPHAPHIQWDIVKDERTSIHMLPRMRTDILLENVRGRTLIIDTKYYQENVQTLYGKSAIRSAHLYQIQSYVFNEDFARSRNDSTRLRGTIDGLLLYAQTQGKVQPDLHFKNSNGNIFMARTLDLNQPFESIRATLDQLLEYV